MNIKAVNKCREQFSQLKKKDYLINPMSEVDLDIVKELREICKKLGEDAVCSILDDYKYLKDEQIHERLLERNMELTQEELNDIEGGDSPKKEKDIEYNRDFIRLNDQHFEVRYIFHWDKTKHWDETKLDYDFGIVLNKVPDSVTKIPIYGNTYIYFKNQKDRDDAYNEYTRMMEDRGDIDIKRVNWEDIKDE
jgi:hypothetical protein